MGVPKFFRYISERYPCLSEKLKEYQIPEFDNLYLDMNGIIHNCSHPNDADVSFRITEETIFKNIFHYVEILFRIIQPQKLFFMAVDGVAPRAKINQQRGRRFRAAKEAEVQEAKAKAKGQDIPKEARFDSNCITPGTVFMSKLNEQLKYFITYKVSTDRLWQKCKIILSGSEVPGEGEHKIMDYIRYMKAQPDYEGNTRHCLYGLDADLIMLGLCSHEPHFSLLREEVKFGKTQKKILTPEETNFCLLHLSLMREYLEHEFSPVKAKLNFKFDIEKIIDDWVLMGFLVGNDFIPHLPNLHIENNALPILYNAYMEILPTLDGYINESGTLNLERFEKFMEKLGHYDLEQFDEIYADLKYFEAKTGRRLNECERTNKSSPDENASPATEEELYTELYRKMMQGEEQIVCAELLKNVEVFKYCKNKGGQSPNENTSRKKTNKALDALIMATENELGYSEEDENDDDSDEDNAMHIEFVQHKRDYYMRKMEYENVDAEIMRSQAEGYIRAIQWNLHYYYNGCCSWSWYYPHHYAPFISDIKNFKDLKLEFDMGKPFQPFEQLLAVLPAASKQLLPTAYHGLMTEENSPIINYYPLDFKTDLNGKKQEWEAVVLIPLIDEKSLLEAMEPCNLKLTAEEKKRNQHGPMSIFTYTESEQGMYEAPEYFPPIRSFAQMILVDREDILVARDKLVKGLCKGVKLSVYYPGFPTLQHIPHTSCLAKAKVKVFEQPSRRENMILSVQPKEVPPINDFAQKWINKTVFIGWPHLIEALVVGVCNSKTKISIPHPQPKSSVGNIRFNTENVNDLLLATWNMHRKTIIETYKTRLGIDLGDVDMLIYASPILGRQYVYGAQGKMTLEKQWNDMVFPYAYQVVLTDLTVHNPDFVQFTSITDVFKPKSICFMLGHPHYGAIGDVVEPGVDLKTSRVKVAMRVVPEPSFNNVRQVQAETRTKFMPGNIAAQRLGISSHLLSRITGTIFVISGNGVDPAHANKQNVGLNLKFNKKNEEVPGFTKKDSNGVWLYSVKAVDFVRSYMQKFPELFERLEDHLLSSDMFFQEDLFPDTGAEGVETTLTWLKEKQKSLGTTRRACGVDELDSEVVQCIERDVQETAEEQRQGSKTVMMQVKPHLLYKAGLNSGRIPPDPKATHRLLDRIICVKESHTVPIGYKGTIVGIQKSENALSNLYEVLFDKPFAGGLVIHDCSPNHGWRLSSTDFINISHGLRIENKNTTKDNTAITNWRQPQQQQQQQPLPVGLQSLQLQKRSQGPANNWNPDFSFGKQKQPQAQGNGRNQENSYQRQKVQPPTNVKKYQPPDAATLNTFHPAFTKSNQANKRNGPNDSPSHNARKPSTNFPAAPVLLQRQPANGNKQHSQINQQGPSEFQTLWNELHKIQKPMESPKKQVQSPAKTKPNPPSYASKDSPHDPSAFLKAMLKISDESTMKPSASTAPPPTNKSLAFPVPPKATDTPPLVQQLFDHARKTEMQSGKHVWYCSRLLSYYQMLGSGFPRYVYCVNKENLVCAQVTLPDGKTFCGEFCRNQSDAAESAAKKVCEDLQLDKMPPPNMQQQPPHQQPKQMRPPPQQWFNNNMGNVRQPPLPPLPPLPQVPTNVKPMLPAGFPQVSLMQIPMPKWSPMVQQSSGYNVPMPGPPLMHMNSQSRLQQPKPPARFPQPPLVSGNVENRSIKQESTKVFVPLQAQKKTRNVSNRQANNGDQKQKYDKRDAHDNKSMEQKPKENVPKETMQDKISSKDKSGEIVNQNIQTQNTQNIQNSQNVQNVQNSQKNQKTVKQRRSRVAAKFQSDPLANGGDRQ